MKEIMNMCFYKGMPADANPAYVGFRIEGWGG